MKGKPKAARGKLWSAYTYLRKLYKKLGLIHTTTEGKIYIYKLKLFTNTSL